VLLGLQSAACVLLGLHSSQEVYTPQTFSRCLASKDLVKNTNRHGKKKHLVSTKYSLLSKRTNRHTNIDKKARGKKDKFMRLTLTLYEFSLPEALSVAKETVDLYRV
jgi:hypothetical protein